MKVIIDNGHGKDTLGKRSPVWADGSQLFEWRYAREIAVILEQELVRRGIDAVRIVPEDTDISLRERCNRVNKLCAKVGAKNCLLVSIHCNAAGNAGKPMQARGWSVFVGLNASQNSKSLATLFSTSAEAQGLKVRVSSPNQRYWAQNLAMCRDTKCPAVLTENLFMDNEQDCKLLLSNEGKQKIVKTHVQAILDYISMV
mgnify:CR=1 FL=1